MKKLLFIFSAVFCIMAAQAQDASFDVLASGNTNGYAQVRFTNVSTLGNKTADVVKDADVAGSPYFEEKWSRAIILLQDNQAVKVEKLKIDLYRNEVHYTNAMGIELVAESGLVKKIFVMDRKDTAKVSAVFEQIAGVGGNNGTAFVQVLNTGKTALLKFTQVSIINKGYDAVAGKDSYGFVSKYTYAIHKDGVVTNLKELGEKAVLSVITPTTQQTAWLEQNKNKLKSEKDIIGFLNYYNGLN